MNHQLKYRNFFIRLCSVATAILTVGSPVFAQQQRSSETIQRQNRDLITKPIQRHNRDLKTKPPEARYECHNHQCTCTIGADCDEMFTTISIVSCKDGAPGKLECTSEPKN